MNKLNHIAIIMDGNGRWGLKKKRSRNYGHTQGIKTVETVIKASIKSKIPFLTLYTFSTENWSRPESEINFLFDVIRKSLKKKIKNIIKQGIKVNIIGRKERLPKDIKQTIKIITKAYNDSDNLTKKFNLNLLKRINNELNGNFKLNRFEHAGIYNPRLGAMESYIISKEKQKVHIKNLNHTFEFKIYEPIHVEYSFKFSKNDIVNLCSKTGFTSIKNFCDSKNYFTDALWRYQS